MGSASKSRFKGSAGVARVHKNTIAAARKGACFIGLSFVPPWRAHLGVYRPSLGEAPVNIWGTIHASALIGMPPMNRRVSMVLLGVPLAARAT